MHIGQKAGFCILFMLLSIVQPTTKAWGQVATSSKSEVIDSLLMQCQAKGIFNGVALVADEGKTILHKAYGYSDLGNQARLRLTDRFYIGSLSKQFTSALILILAEEGFFQLNDPIEKHLPEYAGSSLENVTIHQLLTHTSGMGSYTSHPEFDQSRDYSSEEFKSFLKAPLHFPSGTDWLYSNSGYFLLGNLAESVTGMDYGTLLKKRIFKPLKMRDTGFSDKWLTRRIAKGHWRTVDGYSPMPAYSLSTLYTSGGLFSTASDLMKWNESLYGDQLLSDESKVILFTPLKRDYACGWYVKKGLDEEGNAYERHFHGGWIKGYHAFILRRIPERQLVVLLDNAYNQEIPTIKNRIWSALIEEPIRRIEPKLSNLLFSACANHRLLPLLDSIQDHLQAMQTRYDFEEFDINIVAYRLMENNRLDEAEHLFQFNMDLYPESWNVYDSMGELLLKKGQIDKAIHFYQQSLKLNPKSESGKRALQEIKEKLSPENR